VHIRGWKPRFQYRRVSDDPIATEGGIGMAMLLGEASESFLLAIIDLRSSAAT
jgi:hypothetical protein